MNSGVEQRGENVHYAEGRIIPFRFTEVFRDKRMERKISRFNVTSYV
jgi:hypothetical protein